MHGVRGFVHGLRGFIDGLRRGLFMGLCFGLLFMVV